MLKLKNSKIKEKKNLKIKKQMQKKLFSFKNESGWKKSSRNFLIKNIHKLIQQFVSNFSSSLTITFRTKIFQKLFHPPSAATAISDIQFWYRAISINHNSAKKNFNFSSNSRVD